MERVIVHPRGPWHISATGRYIRHTQSDYTTPNICDMEVFVWSTVEKEAAARLIAMAPRMFDILRGLEVSLEERLRERPEPRARQEFEYLLERVKAGLIG